MGSILTSAYFNLFIKFVFFRCVLESSCLRLLTLSPHDRQVNSNPYGSKVFLLQCSHRIA